MKTRFKLIGIAVFLTILCISIGLVSMNNIGIENKNEYQNESNSNIDNQVSNLNTNPASTSILLERKYYSPDGKNYIRLITDGKYDDVGDISIRCSLNNHDAVIEESYMQSLEEFGTKTIKPEWLDNNRVVIDGHYVFYIDTQKKYQMVDDERWMVSYSISPDKSKIAYFLCENYKLIIEVYDINNRKNHVVYTEKISEDINEDIVNSIGTVLWDINDNIYFVSLDSINGSNPISIINKYNLESRKLTEYSKNQYLYNVSKGNRYITVYNDGGISIIDCITLKSIEINNVNNFYWNSQNNTFIYSVKDISDTIFLGNADTGNGEEKKIDIIDNSNDKYKIFNLRDSRGEFMYDLIKYEELEGVIRDIKTYSLTI